MNFKYYRPAALIPFILVMSFLFNIVSSEIESAIKGSHDATVLYGYVGFFSTVSFITITLLFIDKFGWRFWLFKWLINVPNLNGRFRGHLEMKNENEKFVNDCAVEIHQTGSRITVNCYFAKQNSTVQISSSKSMFAEFIKNINGTTDLVFTYQSLSEQKGLGHHYGTTSLIYFPDSKELRGRYYNEIHNAGSIEVTFSQRNRIGRYAQP